MAWQNCRPTCNLENMQEQIPIHDFTSDDESSVDFELELLEHRESYDTSIPHRHNYYEIFLFIEGGGTHEIDFEVFPIESNSVHFVSPGQVHKVKRELDSFGYVLFFSRDFYYLNLPNKNILYELPFLNNNTTKPILNLSDSDFQIFKSLVESIKNEYRSDHELKEPVIRSYLNIILLKSKGFFDQLKSDTSPEDNLSSDLIYNFKMLVEKNYRKLHLVKEYADLLSTTPEQLNEKARKIRGKTASDLVSDRIILEAKRLLMYSEFSNKEIAYFLNYEDPSYFSRFFKNKIGVSPSEFRENIQKKYLL
ncbi:MAG TPA: helix-turn-helix domain-containing protein [Flavobacteriales bacterium]|nr:helix-turn-helix domain-containing protein [Flavobacteriales bacterium]HIA11223.1 helix-turn-helix domain-containing protein [Flavobacteriales bacterium]HIO72288.1 helix-turn-helix domain-containing protein [Flavobacteriales bacterium]